MAVGQPRRYPGLRETESAERDSAERAGHWVRHFLTTVRPEMHPSAPLLWSDALWGIGIPAIDFRIERMGILHCIARVRRRI
jgi:hypothetical protein